MEELFMRDRNTGIEFGRNKDGMLYLGDDVSSIVLRDTKENYNKLKKEYYRMAKRSEKYERYIM